MQECTLLPQDLPHLGNIDFTRRNATVGRNGRANASCMTGQPALRNFAHEPVRICIAGNVTPRSQQAVKPTWHERTIRHRDDREFRRDRRADADFVHHRLADIPLLALNTAHATQTARMTHAKLRRALQHISIFKARCVLAEELAMRLHEAVRANFQLGLIVNIQRRKP